MDELEFEGACETFVEGKGGLETAGMRFLGVKLGCGAEFLYTDRGNSQFLSGNLGEEVEAVAAHHAEPVGEMCRRDMLVEHLADVCHELVHVVVRLVYVVEDIIAFRHIVNHELHESHDVADICHRLLVLSLADHQELSRGNLLLEVVDIATVTLTEDNSRTDDVYVPVRMVLIPLLKHFLSLPFRLAVVVEGIRWMVFIRIFLI